MLPTKSTFDDYVKKGLVRSQTYKDMTIYQYTEFTPKRVWEALSAGQRIDRMNIPEEFIKWLDDTEKELLLKYNELFDKINQALADTINMTNKEIALSDNEAIKEVREYIFAVRSEKDVRAKIWKAIKPKGDK